MNDNIENAVSEPKDTEIPEMPAKAEENGEKVIPIKYNKEIINLDFERAGELAQKGMKFEAISEELEMLRELANAENKTLKQFLVDLKLKSQNLKRESLVEKCKDDEELKNEVLRLYEQKGEEGDGFDELKSAFPEIKSREDLPESVIENAMLCGRPLLDEYLRYRLEQEKAVKQNNLNEQKARASSAGSQLNKTRGENPETAEFLKGLWRRN